MFGRKRSVADEIRRVASAIEDDAELSARARAAARALGKRFTAEAPALYHQAGDPPPEQREQFRRPLGAWLMAWQYALFEIAYHLGETALPMLRETAFGEYDWTQASATDVLCRLALDGVATQATANEIAYHLRSWRHEQLCYVHPMVARVAAISPVLEAAYERLIAEWKKDFNQEDVLNFILALARVHPPAAERHTPFLRDLVFGDGVLRWEADIARALGTTPESVRRPWSDEHDEALRVRAATVLFQLDPTTADVRARLETWATTHDDPQCRKELTELLTGR